jgi:acetamidase/formamidase
MDLPDVGVGAVVYLPVNTKGALLYLGDCHAAQGDGELCGVAIEHACQACRRIVRASRLFACVQMLWRK